MRDSNRAPDCPTKIVLMYSRLLYSVIIVKPVIRIEKVVPQVIEDRTMKIIGS